MSAPGQTAGLSVFTDPLIRELGISRTEVSTSYLIGTLLGACVLPLTGRALDRWGVRRMTIIIGVAFAVFLAALSFVAGIVGLTVGFVGVRMAGQGALSLAATTLVARSITNRRGLALGIASGIGSGGISLVPVFVETLIAGNDIHVAWRVEAVVVAAVVIPIGLLLPRRTATAQGRKSPEAAGGGPVWTLREAAATGMFWTIAAGLAVSGMLSTALAFHQVAVLGEQGLTPGEAAANFLPQTVTGIAATLITGALSDRIPPKYGVTIAMTTLTGALLLLPIVHTGWTAVLYGLVLGAAGGALRGIEAAAYVRYYGTANIGVIRGVATGTNLASTAFGPLLLALGHDVAGDYTTPVLVAAILPAVVAVVSVFARAPRHPALHS
ncbi:MFS-type transporter [Curtobacterium oceanosedimentum]|uniref:MFS-type transporter n=1 Tax=Curtobacterium oceanosedimentum TaxID=465820 RepID=A0ABR5S8J2_9MICO|nr:MFS transporter [Curtobacterium oceanosedimentum]KTR40798.1 MFS-type transporter [Curtobacterium oceanosedimentum]